MFPNAKYDNSDLLNVFSRRIDVKRFELKQFVSEFCEVKMVRGNYVSGPAFIERNVILQLVIILSLIFIITTRSRI